MNKETLFEAMADVGDDLLVMAEEKRFTSTWRKWGQMAAMLAVVLCVGAVTVGYFNAGGTKSDAGMAQGTGAESGIALRSDGKTAPTQNTNDMEADFYVEDRTDPEAAAEEDGVTAESQEEQDIERRDLTRVVCCGTYFYLEPLSEEMGVPPLGEELGEITQSEEPSLVGCSVYTVPYSTWFTNHAVDGQAVTQCVYIRTPSGYRYGSTANEKIISRYTMEDVKQAIAEENNIWLTDTFVLPIERMGDVEFTEAAELSAEELNVMFWASTAMNTGVSVADYWKDDAGSYVIPITDVQWRLHRFLDAYRYEPSGTQYYDLERNALVYPVEQITYELMEIELRSVSVIDETHLLLVAELPEKGIVREYRIRMDEDSWRYEAIKTVG